MIMLQPFKSKNMVIVFEENNIILKHSTPYYPQRNGLAESTNRNIVNSIKKMLFQNKRTWDIKLKYALWSYRVTVKKSIGTSPFQLVYGIDAIFPVRLSFPVINFLQDEAEEPDEMKRRIFQIVKLQQEREERVEKVEIYRKRVK